MIPRTELWHPKRRGCSTKTQASAQYMTGFGPNRKPDGLFLG